METLCEGSAFDAVHVRTFQQNHHAQMRINDILPALMCSWQVVQRVTQTCSAWSTASFCCLIQFSSCRYPNWGRQETLALWTIPMRHQVVMEIHDASLTDMKAHQHSATAPARVLSGPHMLDLSHATGAYCLASVMALQHHGWDACHTAALRRHHGRPLHSTTLSAADHMECSATLTDSMGP